MTDGPARTFKVLSALLSYPTAELQAAAGEAKEVLEDERLLRGRTRAAVAALLDEMAAADLYDLQERYTHLFDRTRSLGLHLFEHVHGESRDRGQAMVDLAAHYERYGFVVAARELPDYLPLFLEFLSVIPLAEARAMLADPDAILAALEKRLAKRGTPYAAVFTALRQMARPAAAQPAGARLADVPDPDADADPDDFAALDAAWEEAEVRFGPDNEADACGRTRVATRLRAARRDAAAPPPRPGD